MKHIKIHKILITEKTSVPVRNTTSNHKNIDITIDEDSYTLTVLDRN